MKFWSALIFCLLFFVIGFHSGRITGDLRCSTEGFENLINGLSNTINTYHELKRALGVGGDTGRNGQNNKVIGTKY